MRDNIVMINDGQCAWGVEREELDAVLTRLGWERRGDCWIEPDLGPDADPAAAYTMLCQTVQPAVGYDPNSPHRAGDWDDLPTLTYRQDLGRDVWSY